MSRTARQLLLFDCGAAGLAGLLVLALHAWLADLYAFEPALVVFLGSVNLLYACYSGTLAVAVLRNGHLPRVTVDLLVLGNTGWVAACATLVVATWPTSSPFGVAHLLGEGVFVGALALAEFRVLRPQTS